jgi:TolB-like protein
LKNIARPVRVYAVGGAAGVPDAWRAAAPRPARLSLLVLPFANIGGGAEAGSFSDGLTESLTTDLSRKAGAFVVARVTDFASEGRPADAPRIERDLGVRYILDGGVQRSGGRMRISVRLIEAETRAHLWAERFDTPVADLFDMQDEIVARIANELEAQITSAEARRSERVNTPGSADLIFRGFDFLNKGISPEFLATARESFSRALEIEPESIEALLGLVMVETVFAQLYAFGDRTQRIEAAEKLALRALSSAPRTSMAHYCMGMLLVLSNRAEQGIRELMQAISLDPTQAFAHAQIGLAKIALGRAEEAETHISEAMRLSPRDGALYIWYGFMGLAKLLLGADEEAASWLRKAVEANRNYPFPRFHLAAALARLGQIDAARREAQEALALAPDFTLRRLARLSDNPTYLAQSERIFEGMRSAGVPEG